MFFIVSASLVAASFAGGAFVLWKSGMVPGLGPKDPYAQLAQVEGDPFEDLVVKGDIPTIDDDAALAPPEPVLLSDDDSLTDLWFDQAAAPETWAVDPM